MENMLQRQQSIENEINICGENMQYINISAANGMAGVSSLAQQLCVGMVSA